MATKCPNTHWLFNLLALTMALFCSDGAAVAQVGSDFSGTWQQVNERCDPKPRNASLSYRTVIDQHDNILNVSISVRGSRENGDLHLSYEIDGKEVVYTGLDHDEFHTSVHWEGDSLVFNITEHEDGRTIIAKEVCWLSDGGRTLKRVKEANEPKGATRSYVLEKL